MQKSFSTIFSILFFSCLVGQAQFSDGIIARVEGEIITAYDVYLQSAEQEQLARRKLAGTELENALRDIRVATSRRMIESELVFAEFKSLGIEVPEDYLQRRIDDFVKQRAGGSRAKFEEMLIEQEMTFEEFRERLAKRMAVELFVNEKVKRNLDVAAKDIARYYRDHQADYQQKAQIRLQFVICKPDGKNADPEKAIQAALGELKAGKSFGEVAKKFSDGSAAADGGDRGWTETEKFGKSILAVVETLQVGSFTAEPVRFGKSFYLIKLVDRKLGGVAPLNAELEEKIRQILTRDEESRRYQEFLLALRKKYFVKIYDGDLRENWESASGGETASEKK